MKGVGDPQEACVNLRLGIEHRVERRTCSGQHNLAGCDASGDIESVKALEQRSDLLPLPGYLQHCAQFASLRAANPRFGSGRHDTCGIVHRESAGYDIGCNFAHAVTNQSPWLKPARNQALCYRNLMREAEYLVEEMWCALPFPVVSSDEVEIEALTEIAGEIVNRLRIAGLGLVKAAVMLVVRCGLPAKAEYRRQLQPGLAEHIVVTPVRKARSTRVTQRGSEQQQIPARLGAGGDVAYLRVEIAVSSSRQPRIAESRRRGPAVSLAFLSDTLEDCKGVRAAEAK